MNDKKVRITVKDDIEIFEALSRVRQVVTEGRVSLDSFCYHTEFIDGICVSVHRTKAGTDCFNVYRKGANQSAR